MQKLLVNQCWEMARYPHFVCFQYVNGFGFSPNTEALLSDCHFLFITWSGCSSVSCPLWPWWATCRLQRGVKMLQCSPCPGLCRGQWCHGPEPREKFTKDPHTPTCFLCIYVDGKCGSESGWGGWVSDFRVRLNRSVFFILLIHGSATPERLTKS